MATLTQQEKDRLEAAVKAILAARAFNPANAKEVLAAVRAEVMLSSIVVDWCGADWQPLEGDE